MPKDKDSFDKCLRIIYEAFPEAEIVRSNGSREKLRDIYGLAPDVKSHSPISRQSKISCQQLSLDFGDNCGRQQKGAM